MCYTNKKMQYHHEKFDFSQEVWYNESSEANRGISDLHLQNVKG